jgi:serine phosphatase RsbU (regulator of sigma subunit)
MAVPLQTDEQVIGLIYVDKSSVLWDFTRDDLNLLTVLANVTAERIERERLVEVEQAERMHSKELEQAAEIQARLLPGDVPQVPGLDLAGYSAPCRTIGGDYYDFVGYPDASLALMLGDAAGKGMPSALLMSNVQARVRLLAEQPGSLSHLVARLSRAVHSSCPANRFVTFFICRLGPAARNLLYCNAGHNPALLIRGSGQIEKLDVGGMPLGVLPSLEYRESGCDFNPGDLLILYSDGVTEAVKAGSEEEFGPERLAAVVQQHRESTAREIIDAVIESICTWMAGAPYQDDITLVVARRLE